MGETVWNLSSKQVAGSAMHLVRGGKAQGSKPPLLVLHHDIGTPDRLDFYDELAEEHDVLRPHHPGFGLSERPEWARSVRDIAIMYRALLAQLGVHKFSLVGLGFGGWIAAELASMAPAEVSAMVLVGSMGIRPDEGFICDQAMMDYIHYVRNGFYDQAAFAHIFTDNPDTDQLVQWDVCREMCFRVAWKPYMYSPSLPHLLGGVNARSLVVWGDSDQIVPTSTGNLFSKALNGAPVQIIRDCGHYVEMEKPAELVRAIRATLSH